LRVHDARSCWLSSALPRFAPSAGLGVLACLVPPGLAWEVLGAARAEAAQAAGPAAAAAAAAAGEVVAELAGRLAERARSGGPAVLTGPDGLLSGIIGQVLQAGLAAELEAHLDGDVVGFIAGSGGGLTAADLSVLTGAAPYQLEPVLRGVFGRSLSARASARSRDVGTKHAAGQIRLLAGQVREARRRAETNVDRRARASSLTGAARPCRVAGRTPRSRPAVIQASAEAFVTVSSPGNCSRQNASNRVRTRSSASYL